MARIVFYHFKSKLPQKLMCNSAADAFCCGCRHPELGLGGSASFFSAKSPVQIPKYSKAYRQISTPNKYGSLGFSQGEHILITIHLCHFHKIPVEYIGLFLILKILLQCLRQHLLFKCRTKEFPSMHDKRLKIVRDSSSQKKIAIRSQISKSVIQVYKVSKFTWSKAK